MACCELLWSSKVEKCRLIEFCGNIFYAGYDDEDNMFILF